METDVKGMCASASENEGDFFFMEITLIFVERGCKKEPPFGRGSKFFLECGKYM